jgi:hypothetical protein
MRKPSACSKVMMCSVGPIWDFKARQHPWQAADLTAHSGDLIRSHERSRLTPDRDGVRAQAASPYKCQTSRKMLGLQLPPRAAHV